MGSGIWIFQVAFKSKKPAKLVQHKQLSIGQKMTLILDLFKQNKVRLEGADRKGVRNDEGEAQK